MSKETNRAIPPNARQFIERVYEEAFLGERRVDNPTQQDATVPYTISRGQFYEVEFGQKLVRKGETVPLISMPIGANPELLKSTLVLDAVNRRANTALLYVFSDPMDPKNQYDTLGKIANLYGVTAGRIKDDVLTHISDLGQSAPPYVNWEYPEVELLGKKKPHSFHTRQKMAKQEILEILDKRDKGANAKDLSSEYGSRVVNEARIFARSIGVEAPERVNKDLKQIVNKINNPETSLEELRQLIKGFNRSQYVGQYSKGDNAVLVTVSTLQQKAWGNKNTSFTEQACQMLIDEGIPAHSVAIVSKGKHIGYNRFALKRHEEWAVKTLMKAPDSFKGNGVELLAGSPSKDERPSTNDFRKGVYKKVNDPHSEIKRIFLGDEEVAKSSPVTVWTLSYRGYQGIFVRPEDEAVFREFIAKHKKLPNMPKAE